MGNAFWPVVGALYAVAGMALVAYRLKTGHWPRWLTEK